MAFKHLYKRLSQSPSTPSLQLSRDVYCIAETAVWIVCFLVQGISLCSLVFLLILWVGAEYEDHQVKNAPSMLPFYQGPEVCAIVNNHTLKSETFPTSQAAHDEGASVVAHCGECGQCSTPHDIRIYDQTRHTLHGTTASCAKRGLIGGRQAAATCMQENVGFSPGCNDCWLENIACDLRKCVFTCLWQSLFDGENTGIDGQKLNRCTTCDELLCGPQFVTCAGANRRRSGILSDISRDPSTVCASVHPPVWWNDAALQGQWELEQQLQQQQQKQQQQDQQQQQPKTSRIQQRHFIRRVPAE